MADYDHKAVRGWMMYDWATQPFATLMVTFFFAPFYASTVASDPLTGQSNWAWMTAAAGLLLAILAPVMGALADNLGPRKPWILVFSIIYVVSISLTWFAVPGMENTLMILVAFAVATIAIELSFAFTNAFLPEIAPHEEIGRISSNGWAFGYASGFVSVLLVLAFLAELGGSRTLLGIEPAFGLLDGEAYEGNRSLGVFSAIWFIIFIIPFFLWVPDAPRKLVRGSVGEALGQLKRSISSLPQSPSLFAFLGSSMLYRDALSGLYAFGGIYAATVLGWGLTQLGIFAVLGLVFGFIGALIGGRVDKARGPKLVVMVSIIMLTLTCILAISTTRSFVLFTPIAEGSGLPDMIFYFCGCLIGIFGGTLQASSRTLMVHQVEDKSRMTEAFGLYALAGKATAFIAPFFVAVFTTMTGSQQLGITPVIVLFLIGLILLFRVRTQH